MPILTRKDQQVLFLSRARARRNGRVITVSEHERRIYALSGEARVLNRFDRLETRVVSLLATIEALGGAKRSGSKARLERLVQMLEDAIDT